MMKHFSRELTRAEKAVLLILVIFLIVLAYFYFVDKPIRAGIAEANANTETLSSEAAILEAKITQLQMTQDNLDDIKSGTNISTLPSYNNEKTEVDFLHAILAEATDYSIAFQDIERSNDLLRRSFSLQFSTSDYETAVDILTQLQQSDDRCLISKIAISSDDDNLTVGKITVTCSATFYETVVDATTTDGLPPLPEAEEVEESDVEIYY